MTGEPAPARSVCAVMVTFNPGAELIANVSVLSRQVDGIVIVDNASSGAALDRIRELQEHSSYKVIRNDSNLGVAGALNIGLRVALEERYEWIVTFDQDSTVTEGYIDAMLDAARNAERVGIVCPRYRDRHSMRELPMPRTKSGDLLTTMTSGSMVHRTTIETAGWFDERLYIDSVDTEYGLRLRSMGLRLIQAEKAELLHSVGRLVGHWWLGRNFWTTNHSAGRRYYMTRNRLFIFSRYPREIDWIRRDLRSMAGEIFGIVMFEENKLRKLYLIARGMIDGLRGKWGAQVPL